MKYFSQRDKRWAGKYLGNSKTKIGGYGCKLVSLTMLYSENHPCTDPLEVNELLKKGGAFQRDLIDDVKAAEILGMDFFGREYNIDKVPAWYPNMKEVDMSPSPGKQQHFVVRIMRGGKKYIVDPWTGTERGVATYPFVSYRLYKIK